MNNIIVKNNDKYGIIDINNSNEILPIIYDKIDSYASFNLYRLKKDDYISYYDINISEIVPPINISDNFLEEIKQICDEKYYNIIEAIEFYDTVSPICDNMAKVSKKLKFGNQTSILFGFINEFGIEIVPLIYDYVSNFNNGVAVVGIDNKYGVINKTGAEIVPLEYDYIEI